MESLNRRRGAIKRKVTLITKEINELEVVPVLLPTFEEYLSDTETAFNDYVLIKELILTEIDRLESAKEKTATEILALFDDEEEHFIELEKSFVLLKASIKSKIMLLKGASNPNQPLTNNNNQSASKVQLPQMKLPKFTGRYEEFESFREKFYALVHTSTEIKVIQKFQLLLDCCSDNVRKGFEHLEFSEANYLVVLERLQERYSNKKMTVDKHLSGLVGMKSMQKESAGELQRVLDDTSAHVSALKTLGVEVDAWDVIIVYLVSIRLDPETRKKWEETVSKDELPKWSAMKVFLQKRCNSLESVELAVDFKKKPSPQPSTSKAVKSFAVTEESPNCLKCEGSHKLSDCRDFVALNTDKRFEFAKSKRVCFNCFSQSHRSDRCPLQNSCTKCPNNIKKKHSLLLHFGKSSDEKSEDTKNNGKENSDQKKPLGSFSVSVGNHKSHQVILMTALVYVYGKNDQPQLARALLDSASESCFMTMELADKLKLGIQPWSQPIIGIQGAKSNCKGKLEAYIRSRNQDYGKRLEFLVIDRISKNIPSKEFSTKNWCIPSNLSLADPEFHKPGPIDILIGAECFLELLLRGTIKLRHDLPFLQESWLGWVVSGKALQTTVENDSEEEPIVCNLTTNEDLSEQIEKFWKMEDPLNNDEMTLEEQLCEEKFRSQVSRDSEGRYVVGLLLNDKISSLGDTRRIAEARLNSIWKKFDANKELKEMYCEFMGEYLKLGHMKEVDESQGGVHGTYYLPHHGVLKPDNKTTKLRVVFNASQKSTSGISLNDALMNGGLIQPFLHTILMNHRLHRFAFSVDIVKMYRGFRMSPEFTSLLRILFKWSNDGPIKTYEALTVTYGAKDAPFVAVRTLIQIAEDNKERFPLAHRVLMKAFFMDNGLYGSNSLEEAIKMIEELTSVMESAHLKLHKWSANDPRMLEAVPVEFQEIVSFGENENEDTVKTLGMLWKPKEDKYKFVVNRNGSTAPITKRIVLSELARVFDPLGLLNPMVVRAKLFMQKIWVTKFDWDELLPEDLSDQWKAFREDLQSANEIEIPRFINPLLATSFQLIGFSDASKEAYGMCLYVRCLAENGEVSTRLILSKSRVAPMVPVTIPRLELESAVLLSEAVSFVLKSIHLKFESVLLFSDSKVTLSWIKTDPLKLQIYVANRVKKIQKLTGKYKWNYVPTKSNPADIVSRGSSAKKLKTNELWWQGPEMLGDSFDYIDDATEFDQSSFERELRKIERPVTGLVVAGDCTMFGRFHRILKLRTIQRVMALVLRYIDNLRRSRKKLERTIGRVTTVELSRAMEKLVFLVQLESFENKRRMLEEDGTLPSKHSLKSLNLILVNGVIRVGGRISNSNYNYDKKHQMLLPKDHPFTKMLINDLHVRYLHVGPQGLLSIIRERFWLVNGKSIVRKILHDCLVCFKVNPRGVETFMGDLPNCRVEISFPFYHTGVDYAGPIHIKMGNPRSKLLVKAWVALFICMATKAVHLELVTSLSTATFKAALYRFISRRGRPKTMHSDNGTNFIGCKNELEELKKFLNAQNQAEIANYCVDEGIDWSTIPPRASHFGGEWEAGVKSMKYHYKRIAGNASLTYEETLTLLVQIEGVLNSRPLYAMSSDPNDFSPITPAHFLIGRSITNIPELNFAETSDNRLTRFERIVKMRQDFWKRFSMEYVTSLQQRAKWFKQKPAIEVGQLALVKDENSPSYMWKTGRIVRTFPGKDHVVRVVLLRMSNGSELKRDTQKICPLPLENEVTELSSGGNPPPGGEC